MPDFHQPLDARSYPLPHYVEPGAMQGDGVDRDWTDAPLCEGDRITWSAV